MANLGFSCSPNLINATSANTWHIPVTRDTHDIFPALDRYFQTKNPAELQSMQIPAFITFPSLKVFQINQAINQTHVWDNFHPLFIIIIIIIGS
jgi:hypothetical protein